MEEKDRHIALLSTEIESLKNQLFEAVSIIDAIKHGEVDALVLHIDGSPQLYSMESADYTYRILIEKFGEGALSISDNGLILYCNDSFGKLSGLPCDKITGTYLYNYFELRKDYDDLRNNLGTSTKKKEILLTINSRKIPVAISFTALYPMVEAIGVVVTDLTEKKNHELALLNYQQQLEQKVAELNITNTSLGQFIHVISHDLKEPLRKILMYTARLEGVEDTNERNPANIIKSSATRLNSLVDDLVKYAISSTAVKEDIAQIDLTEIMREVTDDLEIAITDSNAKIIYSSLPQISGTNVQMRQLFSNLIVNAIKYSKTDVTPIINITFDTVLDDNAPYYRINIQDNGIGMNSVHLSKIFTIFQRLHMRNEYSGNGIGLAICKKIMENHFGKIKVQSTLHEGSVFSLYFPITT